MNDLLSFFSGIFAWACALLRGHVLVSDSLKDAVSRISDPHGLEGAFKVSIGQWEVWEDD